MEKIDLNKLPMNVDNHSYLNTEKINEIIEWINGQAKITKKELRGH